MSDRAHLKVVPIGTPNLNDVPEMMRNTAQHMQAGEYGAIGTAMLVALDEETGQVHLFGYGNSGDRLRAIGLLNLAIDEMLDGRRA